MSGIAGIYYQNDRAVDAADLKKMVDSLAHRGPDGADMWGQGRVGFGHRMLWTTPESLNEKLPLVWRGGELAITADARIDNRAELIAAMNLADRPGGAISDSELILAAYEKWGEACPEKLIGDFAFAIWDERQQRLFCARDHFGVKPFYYYHSGNLFVFASEIKALLCLSEVPRRLNEVRVRDFLTKRFEDKAITFYQDILRLPAAHYISLTCQGSLMRRYWQPDLAHDIKLPSDDEYVEAFRELFTEAVRCRLRSVYAVGSTLSGGLDSSSVACTAAKVLAENGNRRLHTFSAIFSSLAVVDPMIDERPYIEAVLKVAQFEPHYIHADRLNPLLKAFWQEDEAVPGVNLYLDHAFLEVARQHDIRILLTGHDGDSVVSHGYERLAELVDGFQWGRFFNESAMLAKRLGVSRRRIIWYYGIKPLLPKPAVHLWQRWRHGSQATLENDSAINPTFTAQIERLKRSEARPEGGSGPTKRRAAHWNSLDSGLFQYVHELVDKMAAPFSVEFRHPFLDKRLVEFCIALPLKQKLKEGWTRAILRQAMENRLPKEVQWRCRKGKLSANFQIRLLEQREMLEEVIFHSSAIIARYVDVSRLQQIYYQYASRPLRHHSEALTVNLAVVLALWLQHAGIEPQE